MSTVVAEDVAKKKAEPVSKQAKPTDKGRKPMIVQVRGSNEFKAWAERLSQFDSLPLSSVVDRALRRYAREIGFKEDPPER